MRETAAGSEEGAGPFDLASAKTGRAAEIPTLLHGVHTSEKCGKSTTSDGQLGKGLRHVQADDREYRARGRSKQHPDKLQYGFEASRGRVLPKHVAEVACHVAVGRGE